MSGINLRMWRERVEEFLQETDPRGVSDDFSLSIDVWSHRMGAAVVVETICGIWDGRQSFEGPSFDEAFRLMQSYYEGALVVETPDDVDV